MMIRIAPIAVLVLVVGLVAVLASGCGDDDEEAGVTPTGSAEASRSGVPTIVTSARPSATPRAVTEQLSYVGPAGEIRIVDADGGDNQMLIAVPCEGEAIVQGIAMYWSPSGDYLAYVCAPDGGEPTLVVVDDEGSELLRGSGVIHALWSPDSSLLAVEELEWSGNGTRNHSVATIQLSDGERTEVAEDAYLLAWLARDRLVIALNPVQVDLTSEYEAWEINLNTLVEGHLPRFDDSQQFWVSPAPNTAVVLTPRTEGGAGNGIAVLDLVSGEEEEIDGARIGYPSEGVPRPLLAFSKDGSMIHWANAAESPVSVWSASLASLTAMKVAEVDSIFASISPDGRVAALAQGTDIFHGDRVQQITIVASGGTVAVGLGSLPLGWRSP